ncbi:MAG: glycosyltransferase family 39 protein [Anaerolineae bacterium]|nr:glycosyltransferase family 39 protein [Anaerolineae bacterium]
MALTLLLVVYSLLVGLYSFNTPLFEAPDAYYHFAVIEHIARNGERPPREQPALTDAWQQATYHAPLYYFIAAALIAPLDTSDFPLEFQRNWHGQIGEPHAHNNHNFVAYVPTDWHKTELAVRVVQAFSMVLGGLTLLSIYVLARGVVPTKPGVALLAVLIVMLNPQFIYMSGMINNDNLVTTLTIAALALLIWIVRHRATWPAIGLLSLLLAMNSLAKASGMLLYPPIVLGLLYVGWRDKWRWRQWLGYAALGFLLWVGIASWWYIQNLNEGAEATNIDRMVAVVGGRSGPIDIWADFRGLYYSFWGLFGWFNIIAPIDFYRWTLILMGFAGIGLLIGSFRTVRHSLPTPDNAVIVALLTLQALIILVSWYDYVHRVVSGQGRLWFPLLGGLACAMAYGLKTWRPRWLAVPLLGGMAVAAIGFPSLLIAPTFAAPPQIPIEEWTPPVNAASFWVREPWEDRACLRLWVSPPEWNQLDKVVRLKVAWETLCPVSGYWSQFLHLTNPTLETCQAGDTRYIVAQWDSMPAGGNLPLPAFQIGYVIEDTVSLDLPDTLDLSHQWVLQTGLYDASGTFIRTVIESDTAHPAITVNACAANAVNIGME